MVATVGKVYYLILPVLAEPGMLQAVAVLRFLQHQTAMVLADCWAVEVVPLALMV
jgi:hypothetical protein